MRWPGLPRVKHSEANGDLEVMVRLRQKVDELEAELKRLAKKLEERCR